MVSLFLPMFEPIRLPIIDKEQVNRLELYAPRQTAIPYISYLAEEISLQPNQIQKQVPEYIYSIEPRI